MPNRKYSTIHKYWSLIAVKRKIIVVSPEFRSHIQKIRRGKLAFHPLHHEPVKHKKIGVSFHQ
jgi:hypothetical protein